MEFHFPILEHMSIHHPDEKKCCLVTETNFGQTPRRSFISQQNSKCSTSLFGPVFCNNLCILGWRARLFLRIILNVDYDSCSSQLSRLVDFQGLRRKGRRTLSLLLHWHPTCLNFSFCRCRRCLETDYTALKGGLRHYKQDWKGVFFEAH